MAIALTGAISAQRLCGQELLHSQVVQLHLATGVA